MDLVRTAAPADFFADLTLIKSHLRIGSITQDTYIRSLADTVTEFLDGPNSYLRRALLTQDWKLTICEWPYCALLLPLPRLQSVQSIQYYDISNVLQTLDPVNYVAYTDGLLGRVERAQLGIFPVTYVRPDAIQVTFRCGYGTASDVPKPIRQAALLMIERLFYRGPAAELSVDMNDTEARLLSRHRVVEFT
jgi:uncharacterized phiE125 gp8 family phage protein